MTNKSYNGKRSRMYEEAISKDPKARALDLQFMEAFLSPNKGDIILSIGEGNGFFAKAILKKLGLNGKLIALDPSKDQLKNLKRKTNDPRLEINVSSVEEMDLKRESIDKIWSFGAFHHCDKQEETLKKIYKSLKKGGKLVICDVFQNTSLADYFDEIVARYSITGHNVKFLSRKISLSLCYRAGFRESNVEIRNLPTKWIFNSKKDLGRFIYNLNGLALIPGKKEKQKYLAVYKNCKRILGVKQNPKSKTYELNWPMKVLMAKK